MKPLTIKTSSLLYLLLLACTTLTAFSQSDRVDCDPDNRPDSQDCFQPNSTFEATCAYYTENCPFELCGRDVSNACAACSDSSVIYHRPQACDPEIVVSECSEGVCDSEFDPQSERVFEPVCGFRRGCTGNDCSRTFTNICQACSNSNYPWYQNGVCEDDRKYCGRKEKCSSPSSSNAVCAFFDTEDGGKDQHATVRNARTACTDSAVNYFTKGECEGSSRDNTTYCLPNNRPGFCTKEYNPVCGFYFSEEDEGVLEHKVLGNPCVACHDPSIIYHQPGPCIFTCNRNPNIIFECDGVTVDPVCGSYQEDGEPRQISLKNACIGCYGISTLIDNYTDGLCPGDEGIRCENDAGGFLIGRIFPVCGVFEEGCNDSSCRQTYSESVVACNDENVVLFKAGLCPGDEGVSCAPFRSRPESPNFLSDINYQDVCGYREAGCDDDSCRETFENQYAACGDSAVEFFTAGPCA